LLVEDEPLTDDFVPVEEPSPASKIAGGVQSVGQTVSDAIQAGRRPGMPLDIIARATQEAPLAALAIAFMLGIAFARRR
jgi:hypothetical protein